MGDSSASVLQCFSIVCLYLEEGWTPASIQYFSLVLCAGEAISLVSVHGISHLFKWAKNYQSFTDGPTTPLILAHFVGNLPTNMVKLYHPLKINGNGKKYWERQRTFFF